MISFHKVVDYIKVYIIFILYPDTYYCVYHIVVQLSTHAQNSEVWNDVISKAASLYPFSYFFFPKSAYPLNKQHLSIGKQLKKAIGEQVSKASPESLIDLMKGVHILDFVHCSDSRLISKTNSLLMEQAFSDEQAREIFSLLEFSIYHASPKTQELASLASSLYESTLGTSNTQSHYSSVTKLIMMNFFVTFQNQLRYTRASECAIVPSGESGAMALKVEESVNAICSLKELYAAYGVIENTADDRAFSELFLSSLHAALLRSLPNFHGDDIPTVLKLLKFRSFRSNNDSFSSIRKFVISQFHGNVRGYQWALKDAILFTHYFSPQFMAVEIPEAELDSFLLSMNNILDDKVSPHKAPQYIQLAVNLMQIEKGSFKKKDDTYVKIYDRVSRTRPIFEKLVLAPLQSPECWRTIEIHNMLTLVKHSASICKVYELPSLFVKNLLEYIEEKKMQRNFEVQSFLRLYMVPASTIFQPSLVKNNSKKSVEPSFSSSTVGVGGRTESKKAPVAVIKVEGNIWNTKANSLEI